MNYDLQGGTYLGVGKLFGKDKLFFLVIHDTLYGFKTKKDPRTLFAADDKMQHVEAKLG